MKKCRFILGAVLVVCPAIAAAAPPLVRRPIAPADANGWARVVLTSDAARAMSGVWIGDGDGRSVPFTLEREGLWASRPLRFRQLTVSKDDRGNPTIDFTLEESSEIDRRDREQLTIAVQCEAEGDWMLKAHLAWRKTENGPLVAAPEKTSRFFFDLGAAGRSESIVVPWAGSSGRLTLEPLRGTLKHVEGMTATAGTDPRFIDDETSLDARVSAGPKGGTSLDIDRVDRVVGLDILLHPPAAPIPAQVTARLADGTPFTDGASAPEVGVGVTGVLWNIPALGTERTRLDLAPTLTDHLTVTLPPGASFDRAAVLVRHQAMLFPAEKGKSYFLHIGGASNVSPGSLFALPTSSRVIYEHAPLALGEPETDPQGVPFPVVEVAPDPLAAARKALPWATALLVAGLGFVAFRLFQGPKDGSPG